MTEDQRAIAGFAVLSSVAYCVMVFAAAIQFGNRTAELTIIAAVGLCYATYLLQLYGMPLAAQVIASVLSTVLGLFAGLYLLVGVLF